MSHPALYPLALEHHEQHFVPNAWEVGGVGVCPCGEVVIWVPLAERWTPAHQMSLVVLYDFQWEEIVIALKRAGFFLPSIIEDVERQLRLQEPAEVQTT